MWHVEPPRDFWGLVMMSAFMSIEGNARARQCIVRGAPLHIGVLCCRRWRLRSSELQDRYMKCRYSSSLCIRTLCWREWRILRMDSWSSGEEVTWDITPMKLELKCECEVDIGQVRVRENLIPLYIQCRNFLRLKYNEKNRCGYITWTFPVTLFEKATECKQV